MAAFELVTTSELMVLYFALLYANAYRRIIPENPANACDANLHLHVERAHHYVLLTAIPAAMLLLAVKAGVRAAEAGALSRRLAAEAGALCRRSPVGVAEAIHASRERFRANAWRRRSLRGTLLLAVALSFAASVLAVVAFEDGILYRLGCHADSAGYGFGAPLGVMVVCVSALLHGSFAWTAVTGRC